jgi:spermidine export protein MdtJ
MNSKDLKFYFLLIFTIVFFESIAQYHIKKSKLKRNYLYILIAIFSYSVVCLLLDKCYDFDGMGITNFVWSILSIITMILVGALAFNERITKYDVIGMILSVIGLYLIFIYGHRD